jgi:hypothetical protein
MDAQVNGKIPQPGDIIRLFEWCGVVRHVYIREDEQDAYLEIWFVKNIFKQQKPELQLWSKMGQYIEPATADDLRAEIGKTNTENEKQFEQMLKEIEWNHSVD